MACSEDPEPIPKLEADLEVTYIEEFNSTIYPSFVFGLTELEKQLDEPMNYFNISLTSNVESDVRIVIEESKLNFETIINEQLTVGENSFIPSLKWKYDDLKNLSQPGNVDLTFVAYDENEKELARQNIKLSHRAINECILAAVIENEVQALWWMMAGYVNEDSPIIDQFLQEVLETTNLSQFDGYQSGEEGVDNQVEAIFYTLREKGIKYSSITNTSNSNPNVVSQYIRFADEVLTNTQANCADGTVFFCSVLMKIGINPLMVFVPGHVYLAYYLDEDKTSIRLLETTTVGNESFTFIDAVNLQIDGFNESIDEFSDTDYFDGYFVIDIEEARQIIKPIGR